MFRIRLSFINSLAAAVQDACLLAMLRISVDCIEVPPEVMEAVTQMAQLAGRHIRRVSVVV